MDHERSGAGGFEDMGERWVAVREGARQRTLRTNEPAVKEIAERWEQFIQWLCLGLRQDLGRAVSPMWPKDQDQAARLDQIGKLLVAEGRLGATIRIPDAAGPIEVEADLRTKLLTCFTEILAPKEGRAKTRVTWLLRQVKDAPPSLRIEARYPLERLGEAWARSREGRAAGKLVVEVAEKGPY